MFRRFFATLLILLSLVCHDTNVSTQAEHLRQVWNEVDIVVRNADGSIAQHEHVKNFRTNAGGDAQASQMADTSTQSAACNQIAVSTTAITPALTDTTLSGEVTTNGLGRAVGTFTSNTNSAHTQFTLVKTFTASGTVSSVQAGAVFNASSGGSLCWEATWSPVNLVNTQTITITWTVNY
jgi:hypothetical protein